MAAFGFGALCRLSIKPTSTSFSQVNSPLKSSVRWVWQRSNQKSKKRGIKKKDGELAKEGETLVTQFLLNYHPGLNVRVGSDRTLYATLAGRVMITWELFNPDPKHPFVTGYYSQEMEMKIPLYKKYVHVIPEPQSQKFKLVDLI